MILQKNRQKNRSTTTKLSLNYFFKAVPKYPQSTCSLYTFKLFIHTSLPWGDWFFSWGGGGKGGGGLLDSNPWIGSKSHQLNMRNYWWLLKFETIPKFPTLWQYRIKHLNFLPFGGLQGDDENCTVSRQTFTANKGRQLATTQYNVETTCNSRKVSLYFLLWAKVL